jgi:hypothetical protein
VVRVTNIPDGATAETMGKQLAKLLDPFDLPVLVEWSELARAD